MTKRIAKYNLVKEWGREPRTLNELAFCLIAKMNRFENTRDHVKKDKQKKCKVVGFKWNIIHLDYVSNTHYAPRDGVTNWRQDPALPLGYPGWHGRVWVRYAEPINTFGNAPLSDSVTYTGTGGVGSYNGPWNRIYSAYYNARKQKNRNNEPQIYSWDYRFFDQDWPELIEIEHVNKEKIWDKLKGIDNPYATYTHTFEWNDAETVARDNEFLSKVKSC